MNDSKSTSFADLIFKKWSENSLQLFYDFYVMKYLMTISLTDEIKLIATVVHTFCRPHFVELIFKKCPPPKKKKLSVFFDDFFVINRAVDARRGATDWNRPALRIRVARNTLKQRPSSGRPHLEKVVQTATLPEKNTGCCAWESFQQWIHAFPIAHTSQLLDDDNDVIDMMMWLTWWLRWWCGCHDGETASHVTIVRNSEVS